MRPVNPWLISHGDQKASSSLQHASRLRPVHGPNRVRDEGRETSGHFFKQPRSMAGGQGCLPKVVSPGAGHFRLQPGGSRHAPGVWAWRPRDVLGSRARQGRQGLQDSTAFPRLRPWWTRLGAASGR